MLFDVIQEKDRKYSLVCNSHALYYVAGNTKRKMEENPHTRILTFQATMYE